MTLNTLSGRRIRIVIRAFHMGGAERNAIDVATHLKNECGADVSILGVLGSGEAERACESAGIPKRALELDWPSSRSGKLRTVVAFQQALRRERPDAILAYTILPNVLVGLTWRYTSARSAIWRQGDNGVARMPPRLERWAVDRMPAFVAASASAAEFLNTGLRVPPSRVSVIYKGVPLPVISRADRTRLRGQFDLMPSDRVACMVANLRSGKDHITLLHAWRHVLAELDSAAGTPVLLLAGRDDNLGVALKALAFELDLGRHVRFLGYVEDIPSLLACVDVGTFASTAAQEACPLGVTECMAAGLPVAATDIPGIREAVGPDGYAFLSPEGNAKALAENLVQLLGDPTLRHRVGGLAQAFVRHRFDPAARCRDVEELFVKLLN
jgi:glycosyltransferase involved in cell wall biosynthesis